MRRSITLLLVALVALSLFVPAAAADLEYGDERAELDVYQQPWIDEEPSVDRSSNRTVYEVRGDEYEVQLANVDHEDVDRVAVADGGASIEYEESRDVYHVEPDGEGTIAIYWDVSEPVLDENGTETNQTEQTRYAASLQVSDTGWTHLSDEQYQDQQDAAANWSEVVSEANRIGVSPSWMLSVGVSFAEFASSPGAELIAGVQAAVMVLTLEPGGLLVLTLFLALIAGTAAVGYRWKHRFKQQVGDHDRAREELQEAWRNKARKIAQQWDWPTILPDHHAQWMHDKHGPNVWHGLKNYQMLRSPLHTKGLLLQCMTQLGYRGVVHYDADGAIVKARAMTHDEYDEEYGGIDADGSSGDDSGIIDLDRDEYEPDGGVLETEEIATVDFEELRFDDPAHREIIDAIPADDLDESVFLPSVDLDLSRVSLPIDNHNVDDADLVQLLDPEIPGDFESYEQFARVHAKMLETVVNHPTHTDKNGNVREEMDLISFMSELDSVLADKAEFDVADTQRKMLYMIADELDANDRVEDTIGEVHAGGVGRTDERTADVIGPEDIDLGGSNPRGGPS